jgi:Ca2+-binding EF-hand superfamily protein
MLLWCQRLSSEDAFKHHWFKEQLDEDNIHVKSNHVISAHSRRMVANFSEYLAKKRLKKVALNFIANDMTEAEAEPLLAIFQKITKSEKDIITVEELDDAIDQGDFSSSIKAELTTLRDNLDRSGVVSVNWKEFVVQFMDKNIAKREENIQKILKRFSDKGAKTHLGLADVAQIFGGEEAAKEIFDYLDKEGKGQISLKDFQKAVEQSLDEHDAEEEADFGSDDEFHDG